jgi:hypothetical protein
VSAVFVCTMFVLVRNVCDLTRLQALASPRSYILWLHRRISPNSHATSSSEFSSLEEQMRGRHRFSNESAIPPRDQRSSGSVLVDRGIASGYVLYSSDTYQSHCLARSNSNLRWRLGRLFLMSAMADRDNPTRSVACTTLRTRLFSQSTMVIFSTTPADSRLVMKRS